jgi:hypothetical protein
MLSAYVAERSAVDAAMSAYKMAPMHDTILCVRSASELAMHSRGQLTAGAGDGNGGGRSAGDDRAALHK